VARWRTSLAVVALPLALALTGCGREDLRGGGSGPAATPTLAPVQQQPLVVKGTGFRPGEKVVLAAKGLRSSHATARADEGGAFEATFRGLKNCDSVTVVAVGSKGSRAEFNLSQIACTDS
jgi:hypothetical protein